MIKALIIGSFDPPTIGHLNIIERTAKIFSHVDVVIGMNTAKKYMFSEKERTLMVKNMVSPIKNITVHVFSGLTVDICKELSTNVLIRGVRNSQDFYSEYDMSIVNKMLCNSCETLFIPSEPQYATYSSSFVKEIASFGGDFSEMVTPYVKEMIDKKIRNS